RSLNAAVGRDRPSDPDRHRRARLAGKARRREGGMSRLLALPEARLAVIAIAVFAALSLLAPDRFLSAQNVTSMAFQFPEFAILALAMTITMLTGGIDLSVVGAANLSAIVAALILTRLAPGSA